MQPNPSSGRLRDRLLFILGITGCVILAGRGIYLIITLFQLPSATDQASGVFDAFGMFFCAALLLPLLVFSVRKMRGAEIQPARIPAIKIWQLACIFGGWILTVILGSILNTLPNYGWLMALPFFMLGIAMPVAGLAWIAIGGIPLGSSRRLWAAFDIGMTGSTLGALLLEYSLVGIAALVIGIVVASNPEWLSVFQQVKDQVTRGGDIQSLLTKLAPYLTNPVVLVMALIFASILAPLIEETLKPAAVWLLGKRIHSPAQGFALGGLCGSGFALLEGTLAAGGNSQMLGIGIAARATSSLMHITASGLMGWGIASAYLDKRIGRLAGAYMLAVFIHGIWNGSVVLAVFGGLRLTLPGGSTDWLGILLVLTGIGILGSMLVTITILLPVINHRLRSTPAQSDIIAPPSS
jgi:PrsW family intramembrane metalloprotease